MAVRNESVRLSLDDAGFTTGMAKAAAATKLLDNALDSLDGNNVDLSTGLRATTRNIDGLGTSARRSGADLDSFTSRLGLVASAVGAIGPSLIPISAVAIPAVTGLASQFGFAAIGAGTLVAAVQGVGDALTAVNDAALEPTAANLEKAREAMARLGPEAQQFVTRFQEIRPVLKDMRDSAAAGWFPGLTESLDSLVELGPRVEEIMRSIGEAGGSLVAEGADALAGPQWEEFLAFVQGTAPAALEQLGRTIGNVATGMAELWMAFAPLNADFGSFMLDASRGFAAWADGLAETEGFQDFVEYIRKSGPQVADALGSIGSAAVELVQAFAPLGGGVLRSLSVLADVIGAIANSPIGPPIAALVTAMSAIRLAGAASAGLGAFTAGLTGIKPAADGARLSLLDLGKQFGIVAAAAYSAKIGFDVIDSYNRYSEASTATASSVQELEAALSNSNVGAAAKDFDIDLKRLAEDLVANGTAGDYYTEVVTRMGESNKGFLGTLSGASDLMGPWIGDTERAQQAFADLANIIDNNGGTISKGFFGDLADLPNTLHFATESTDAYANAIAHAGTEAGLTADDINVLTQQMRGQANAALSAFDANTAWGQAVADARKQARTGAQGLDEMTRAGRANREALSGLAETWNAQPKAVKNSEDAYRDARQTFLEVADAMGVGSKKARQLADDILEVPRKHVTEMTVEEAAAKRAIQNIKNALAAITDETVFVNIQRRNLGDVGIGPNRLDGSADGTTVPKTGFGYADRHPYLLADGEEVVSNRYGQADRWRPFLKAINSNRLADGGTTGRSVESALELAQMLAGIRDLRRQLAADGKDELQGLKRRIAELQLEVAQKELRLAKKREEREERVAAREKAAETRSNLRDVASSFSLDGLVPDAPQTVTQGALSEIAELRADIRQAGGEWTRGLTRWAKGLVAAASELDDTNAALERETQRRDDLVKSIADQQQALDQLASTMASFSAQVAGNFLNNPFNQTISGGAQSAELTAALEQLAAIRSSATGDSVSAAAQASVLIAAIRKMQAESSSSTGVAAFESTLDSDLARLDQFSSAISTLTGSLGLDSSGGLFRQLLEQGDVATATGLAGMTSAQIDDLEAKFQLRADKAAAFAVEQTQVVMGPQQAALQSALDASQAELVKQNATLTVLTNHQVALEAAIRRMDAGVGAALEAQTTKVTDAQKDTTRATKEVGRDTAERLRWMFN